MFQAGEAQVHLLPTAYCLLPTATYGTMCAP
jgi:hypothetical protein